MSRTRRRGTKAGIGIALAAGAVALPAVTLSAVALGAPASDEPFVTDVPELGGYRAEAVSSPVSALLFEPVIPVPAGPGEPHGELHGSYSRATLGTGPASRGLGSAIWPGPTAGDGLSAFDERIPAYPLKASATYPDGPFEQRVGDPQSGSGMYASSRGVDVLGYSDASGTLVPNLLTVGALETTSTTNVVDGVVVAETVATFEDLQIAGVVTIASLQTRLVARSDGRNATTTGTYTVAGLAVAGHGSIDVTTDRGSVTLPSGDPITIPLRLGNDVVADAIGVTIQTAPVVEELDGPTGRRSTRGLIVTLDTSVLREMVGFVPLAEVISQIPDPGVDVVPCDELPDEMSALPCFSNPVSGLKANLFTLAALRPEMRFLLGGAQVTTTASLPFEFTPPSFAPVSGGFEGSTDFAGGSGLTAPAFTPSSTSPEPVPEPSPQVAAEAPAGSRQPVALQVPAAVPSGVNGGIALLAVMGIALVARGGRRLTLAAIDGVGGQSTSVIASAVPDLRAFARERAE